MHIFLYQSINIKYLLICLLFVYIYIAAIATFDSIINLSTSMSLVQRKVVWLADPLPRNHLQICKEKKNNTLVMKHHRGKQHVF
jgi:hypothetical protein